MALGSKIIDLIRLHLLNDTDKVGAIGQISVVKNKPWILLMGILIKMIDSGGIETACTPLNHALHIPSTAKTQLNNFHPAL